MPLRLTRTVRNLMIICFVMFVLQHTIDQFFGGHLLQWFGLVPDDCVYRGRVWQLVTYVFIHADVMHLFFNLMMIAFIGSELEVVWGRVRFLKFFFLCTVSAAMLYLGVQLLFLGARGLHSPMVGASGAIYGMLVAYGILFGERILLFMMLFPMKAKHFVWVLALIELMTTVYASRGGWASLAHLGGMAAGWSYFWVSRFSAKMSFRPKANRPKKKKNTHLKLVINNPNSSLDSSEEDSEEGPKTWH